MEKQHIYDPSVFNLPATKGDVAGVAVMAGACIQNLRLAIHAIVDGNAELRDFTLKNAIEYEQKLSKLFDQLSGYQATNNEE